MQPSEGRGNSLIGAVCKVKGRGELIFCEEIVAAGDEGKRE